MEERASAGRPRIWASTTAGSTVASCIAAAAQASRTSGPIQPANCSRAGPAAPQPW